MTAVVIVTGKGSHDTGMTADSGGRANARRLGHSPVGARCGLPAAVAVFAALTAGFGCLLAVVGEIARAAGTAVAFTAAMIGAVAVFAALAAGFRCLFVIVGKVPGALLASNVAGPRRLIAIFCEISGVPAMSLFCHLIPPCNGHVVGRRSVTTAKLERLYAI